MPCDESRRTRSHPEYSSGATRKLRNIVWKRAFRFGITVDAPDPILIRRRVQTFRSAADRSTLYLSKWINTRLWVIRSCYPEASWRGVRKKRFQKKTALTYFLAYDNSYLFRTDADVCYYCSANWFVVYMQIKVST